MTSTASLGETLCREFGSDNTGGASPQIIEAVAAAAAGAASPYGNDIWTERLTGQLAEIFDHRVHLTLVSTGTAANVLSLASLTPPWGAVLCHRDSHVVNDECSAPEFFTRLVGLPGADAKIAADELAAAVRLDPDAGHRNRRNLFAIGNRAPQLRRRRGRAARAHGRRAIHQRPCRPWL